MLKERGGAHTFFSLDALTAEERFRLEQIDPSAAPEKPYDRHWAHALLDNAFDQLRFEMTASGKGAIFELLRGQLSGSSPVPYPNMAVDLGVSEGAPALRQAMRYAERVALGKSVSQQREKARVAGYE